MNRGIYPILSGAIAQEQRLQVVANNVANAQTNGYKRDEPLFQSVLSRAAGTSTGPSRSGLFPSAQGQSHKVLPHAFVYIQEHKTEMGPGRLRETKNYLHTAIQGTGFFEIKTSQGPRFTKNGMFSLDNQRQLVTAMGDPVMGAKGEIKVPPGEVKISDNGSVTVDGNPVNTLRIVEFGPQAIKKTGDGMFHGDNPVPVTTPTLTVGYVEESNVNSLEEMVKVISAMRNFESAQKAISAFDTITQAAIQDVGRVM
jgi:flagellar basal-body rod protein FlgG